LASNSQFDPPAPDEIEVSVFGPGYGEAIILHLGAGKWILVDSCKDPASGLPAPVKYLHDLNVSLQDAVKLIVATHWHDDHVCGISNVFDECASAEFAISDALRTDEFLQLVGLYRQYTVMRSSGLDEFTRVFELLQARRERGVRFNSPKLASADKLLYRDQIPLGSETVEAYVYALSPSDVSILQAKLAFAELLPREKESKRRVASPTPNYASVVLWIEVGDHKILLGADLQKTPNPKTGWSVILSDSTAVSGRAGVFKIPHHGSENAHHERVWSELLSREPFAIVTSFRRGTKALPSPEDIERITGLTPRAYATAPPGRRRQKWGERVVRDLVRQVTRHIQSVHYGWGHVRLRQKISEKSGFYHIELFGDAYALRRQ
jgi:hypothetical protein